MDEYTDYLQVHNAPPVKSHLRTVLLTVAAVVITAILAYGSYFLFVRHNLQHQVAEDNFRSIGRWGLKIDKVTEQQAKVIMDLQRRVDKLEAAKK